jgi:uncharacterized Ntn-hydrolase superfamily protein
MPRRTASALAGATALLLTLASPARATVSILAVDPTTGQVGVAAAACVQYDLGRIVTLVPGVGVAVSQGHARPEDPMRFLTALRSGTSSESALEQAVGSHIPSTAQYAVVTLGGGAAYTAGAKAPKVAAQDPATSLMVIGTDLPNIGVVHAAGMAFAGATGDLPSRLLAALRASSKAGGDRRCHAQTATAALLIVARPGEDPVVPSRGLKGVRHRQAKVMQMIGKTVAADEMGDLMREAAALRRPTGPGAPDVYLSLIQSPQGFDAVALISQAYRQLQASPSPSPVAAPPVAVPAPAAARGPSVGERAGWVLAWIALGLVALAAWWTPRWRGRRRDQDEDVDEVGASRSGS